MSTALRSWQRDVGARIIADVRLLMQRARRLLTVSPEHEPLWVRLYVHQIGDKWAAMIVADDAPPPEPGSLTGQAFFGDTPEEAELAAKVYLGGAEPAN